MAGEKFPGHFSRVGMFAVGAPGWLRCRAAHIPFPKDEFFMKKTAAKTLGVAALGAAFAAAAAGSASAAPTLPLDTAAGALPVSSMALDTVSQAAQNAPVQETVGKVLGGDATDAVAPALGLLGGLPTQGLTANGIPLGG